MIDNKAGRTPHTDITNRENESETSFFPQAPLATAPEEESIWGGLDFPIRRQPKREEREKKPFDLCLRLEGIFLASFNVLAYVLKKFFVKVKPSTFLYYQDPLQQMLLGRSKRDIWETFPLCLRDNCRGGPFDILILCRFQELPLNENAWNCSTHANDIS